MTTRNTLDQLIGHELDDLAEHLVGLSSSYRGGKRDGTEVQQVLATCDDLARFAERVRAEVK